MFLVRFLPLVCLVFAASAYAGSAATLTGSGAPGEYDQGLSGSVALGYTSTSGNTNTSNLDVRAGLTYGTKKWYYMASAKKIRATEDDALTADSVQAQTQADYLFTPNNYAFLHLGYSNDQFGGIKRRTSETAGYGRRIVHTSAQDWSAQIGAGAHQEHLKDGTKRTSAIVQLATSYTWQFAENSSFGEAILVEHGSDNTRSQSTTSLTVKLIKNFSLLLVYRIEHNTHVPPTAENTDRYTSVSLEYSF